MQLPALKNIIQIILTLIIIGVAVFFFWNDISNLLGLSNVYKVTTKDMKGVPITFVAGTRTIMIPPNFSEDVLSNLKQEKTEAGGMPLRVERKGNLLPFGIP